MIPKIIHYCWFGPQEKSEIAQKCIASWRSFCPDFEFKEWTEKNSANYHNKFYRDAYRKKKYAFVADCVRIQALYEYGGVYLDVDMLLIKSIDDLLSLDFFSGFEVDKRAAYGLFGGIAKHRFFDRMKQFYDSTPFNEFSLPVITHTFSPLVQTENLNKNEQIFSLEYFYALPYQNRNEDHSKFITEKSYAVHLWDHSWKAEKKETTSALCRNLRTVTIDYVFYGYPWSYFRRYFKEFSRKIYHRMIGKKTK
jgi:mannosyltransferase OCH1-like enzyme